MDNASPSEQSGHNFQIQPIEPHKVALPPSILEDYEEKLSNVERLDSHVREPAELQHRNLDDDTRFWQIYVSESGKFDKEMIDNWNDTLNSLLLFAALFSAINTAFIIESYKRLQPDAVDSTNSLLKLILQHRNDNETISLEDSQWDPPPDAIRVNSELFASLACSLLASFGAILGKEMLAEYKSSGALSTLPEQGRTRQRKYNGLKRYRFRLLMQILPMMLQLSLALFLLGIIDFVWKTSVAVALVVMVPVALGAIAYLLSVIVAIKEEDSPFQTSLSKSFRLLIPPLKHVFRSFSSSIHNYRTYATTRGSSIGEGPWEQFKKSTFWVATTSGLNSMTLAVNKMAIVRYVRRSLRNFMITLYNGVLGGSELLIGLSSRFEVGVSMTSYKWLMTGWTTVVSLLRLGSTKKGQDFAGGTITDNVNSDCVVWLLKKSQDTEILRKALEAVPSLPAGMLLERFKAQPNLLKRYVFMYISALQRHPGDIDFRLDDESMRDAIISGTALFHVLKSRLEVDRQDLMIEADIDPELRDALERDILHSQFDFSLKTVFHCIKTQTGEAKVFGWDLILLPTFLERFLVILQTRSHSAQSTNTSSPPPFVRSPSPITLLLDSLICLVAHISRHPPPNSHVELLVSTLDDTLLSLHKILQIHPKSMALTSHVALSVAHIQWLKRRCGSEVHSEKPAVDGIQLNHLRNAWLATDKQADGVSNIVLAFNLVGLKDSLATIDIYLDLLTLTDGLTPKAMDISWRLKDWEKWWFEIVQIIPGLLRFLRQIDLNERPEVGHLAVRLLARLIPDDWLFGDITKELEKPENVGIRLISPFHPEYGSDMTALISSVVASFTSILDSLDTRKNVAEVFCLMLAFPEVIRELPSLIENPGGMFQQSISIPALLISVVMDDKAENFELASRTAYVYNSMLKLPIQERSLIASFQFEALALGLANLRSGSNGLLLFYGVVVALNRLAPNEGFSWPTSFMKPRIRVARYEASPYKKTRVEFVENEVRDYREQFGDTWRGEGLMILWRRLAAQNDFDPGRISYMFRQDVILTVLDCFDRSVPINYQISSDNMVDYLENALVWGGINDELKGRIDKVLDSLKFAAAEGWEALIIRYVGDKNFHASE